MLRRKIEKDINSWLDTTDKAFILLGARQVGKTYIIRHCLKESKKEFFEINLLYDSNFFALLDKCNSFEDYQKAFNFILPQKIKKDNLIIFLDECQELSKLITILKEFVDHNYYRFIVSGSLLGNALKSTKSIPAGRAVIKTLFPLDFEEYITANNLGHLIEFIEDSINNVESLDEVIHTKLYNYFLEYLCIGGLPETVTVFLESKDINKVREISRQRILEQITDFTKYNIEKRLTLERLYTMIPTFMLNDKREYVVNEIDKNIRHRDIQNNLDWLKHSGYVNYCYQNNNPLSGLLMYLTKSFKLYIFDVGILTSLLGKTFQTKLYIDSSEINKGGVFESFIAQELTTNSIELIYYHKNNYGEVDFLVEQDNNIIPIEVKSGTNYQTHKALTNLLKNAQYKILKGIVLSPSVKVECKNNILYLPIFYITVLKKNFEMNKFI